MSIPFSPPDIREEDIQAVVDVLKSGWITTGPVGAQFEKELASYTDAAGALLTSSATTAEETIFRFLGIGPGDEVIVPAYTYTATASAALHVGADIVMVDNAPDSFTPSVDAILEKVTSKTKAIVTVDLGGVLYDHSELISALEKLAVGDSEGQQFSPSNSVQEALGRIAVISDAAHSLGAKLPSGLGIGANADFCSVSFHAVKNLTTAEGGAVLWRDIPGLDSTKIYRDLRVSILHGQSKDALAKTKLGGWEYDIEFAGHKANMPDVLAALGLSQLQRYDETLARRREITQRYAEALKEHGVDFLHHDSYPEASSCHLFLAVLPPAESDKRNQIIDEMAKRGVAANVHYKPLPALTAYKNLGFKLSDFPNAAALSDRVISFPLHTKLSDEDVQTVIDVFDASRKAVGA